MTNHGEEKKKTLLENSKINSYLKYSNIAFQLIGLILLGYWIGNWVDGKTGTEKPYWTAGIIVFLIMAFLISTIYNLIKDE